jgi:thiosulfate reductase cytochrome b subunit
MMKYMKDWFGKTKDLRRIGRLCGWAALFFLLLAILTGYGITDFRIVGSLTLGLLGKASAQRLHPYMEIPIIVLLVIHIGIVIWSRRDADRRKDGEHHEE